jgi:hypothetical protein
MATMTPDYGNKAAPSVYMQAADLAMESRSGGPLDFLGYAINRRQRARHPPPELGDAFPTWLPNWFEPVDIKPIAKKLLGPEIIVRSRHRRADTTRVRRKWSQTPSFNASASAPCSARIVGLRFHVQAVLCDHIEDTISSDERAGVAVEKIKAWHAKFRQQYPTGETFNVAMRRAVVTDLNCDAFGRATTRGASWELKYREERQLPATEQQVRDSAVRSFNVAKSCRNLGVTRKGYVGMVPDAATAGDAVYAFVGGQVLDAVREEHGRVVYLGEAYLHGLMDGEVMAWVRDGRERIVDLVLD